MAALSFQKTPSRIKKYSKLRCYEPHQHRLSQTLKSVWYYMLSIDFTQDAIRKEEKLKHVHTEKTRICCEVRRMADTRMGENTIK